MLLLVPWDTMQSFRSQQPYQPQCLRFSPSRGWKRWGPREWKGQEGPERKYPSCSEVSLCNFSHQRNSHQSSWNHIILQVFPFVCDFLFKMPWISLTLPVCFLLPSFLSLCFPSSSPPLPQTTARRPKVSPLLKVLRASRFYHFDSLLYDRCFTSRSSLCVCLSVCKRVEMKHHQTWFTTHFLLIIKVWNFFTPTFKAELSRRVYTVFSINMFYFCFCKDG